MFLVDIFDKVASHKDSVFSCEVRRLLRKDCDGLLHSDVLMSPLLVLFRTYRRKVVELVLKLLERNILS